MPFQTHSRGPGGRLGFTIDLLIVSGRPGEKVSQPGWENRINLVGPENAMSRPSRYCWATTTHISWPLSLQSCATTFLGDAPSRWLTGNFDGRSTDLSTDLFRWIASGDLTVCEAIAHWVRWFTKNVAFPSQRVKMTEGTINFLLQNQYNQSFSIPFSYYNVAMWLKQCHVYHPPVISIFIGGMEIPFPLMDGLHIYIYIIVLTTLYAISMDFPYVKPPEALKKVCCVSGIGVQGVPGVQAPCSAAGMYWHPGLGWTTVAAMEMEVYSWEN